MTSGIIGLLYFVLTALSIYRLRRLQLRCLCFADGLLVATLMFIAAPLLLVVLSGSYASVDLTGASAYEPFVDVVTTLNLQLGWLFVIIFQFCWHVVFDAELITRWRNARRDRRARFDFRLLLSLLLLFSFTTFVMSGRAEGGGHWQEKIGEAFSNNFALIIIANFYNAYRAMIFGMLVYTCEVGIVTTKRAFTLGALIVVIDVALSFNRITAAYFFIFMLLIFRRQIARVLGITMVVSPVASYFSHLWGIIRGLALIDGYSVEGFVDAISISLSAPNATEQAETIAEKSNAILETSNLQVFHNVVERVPDMLPVLWGQTYILRPLAIFIPVTVWPSKPISFNVILGEHIGELSGLALNTTFFGEPYGNFYLAWPFAFLFMMTVSGLAFRALSKISYFFNFWSFFCAIAFARFDMGFVVICCVSIIAYSLIRFVMNVVFGFWHRPSSRTRRRQCVDQRELEHA